MKAKLDDIVSDTERFRNSISKLGHNRELFVEVGIVVSEPPDLKIEVDGDIILEADDLIVAEHLTKHSRIVTIEPQEHEYADPSYITFGSDTVTESMSAEGLGPHVHDVTQITLDNVQRDFLAKHVRITYDDELKLGDRVLIISDDETDEYYVIDRVVEYVAAE